MKYLFYFILVIITLLSCQSDDDIVPIFCEEATCDFDCIETIDETVWTNDCQDNHDCSFQFFDNSTIETEENAGIISGNNRVFQFQVSTEGAPEIADDEFTNILLFELDSTQESFTVSNGELENINLYFRRICYCLEIDYIKINKGCLQGKRLPSGRWAIQGNVEAEYDFGTFPITFEANFE